MLMSCQLDVSKDHIFVFDDFYFLTLNGPFQVYFYFKQSQLPHCFHFAVYKYENSEGIYPTKKEVYDTKLG